MRRVPLVLFLIAALAALASAQSSSSNFPPSSPSLTLSVNLFSRATWQDASGNTFILATAGVKSDNLDTSLAFLKIDATSLAVTNISLMPTGISSWFENRIFVDQSNENGYIVVVAWSDEVIITSSHSLSSDIIINPSNLDGTTIWTIDPNTMTIVCSEKFIEDLNIDAGLFLNDGYLFISAPWQNPAQWSLTSLVFNTQTCAMTGDSYTWPIPANYGFGFNTNLIPTAPGSFVTVASDASGLFNNFVSFSVSGPTVTLNNVVPAYSWTQLVPLGDSIQYAVAYGNPQESYGIILFDLLGLTPLIATGYYVNTTVYNTCNFALYPYGENGIVLAAVFGDLPCPGAPIQFYTWNSASFTPSGTMSGYDRGAFIVGDWSFYVYQNLVWRLPLQPSQYN